MAPLKTLVIAPTPFFGDRGCHIRIYEEVRALARRGVESLVVTYPTGRNLPDVAIERAQALPGVQAAALGPSLARPVLDAMLWRAVRRAARRFQPDLLHAHLHEGILIGAWARRRLGLPLLADLQGSLTAELVDHAFLRERGLLTSTARRLEAWLVRRPDRILTSSAHVVSLLTAQGVPPETITPFPDGVDLDAFRPRPPDPELVTRLGLTGKRVVVFLGVLTSYQGVDLLLDAVPRVVRAVGDVHFLIMGYPNEDRYRARVQASGLAASVSLPGRIDYAEAARWICLGEVAVSPKRSLSEANGKLLNYMACGRAVVASDTPVNRELLGEAGTYAPVGDATGLADRIIELLRQPGLTRARGASLRRRAEQGFGWPALAARLEAVYRELLGQRRPAGA